MILSCRLLVIALLATQSANLEGQPSVSPDTVTVTSGPLHLRGLIWRPVGNGPFPAVLFNHGSYSTNDTMSLTEPATVGPVFARHGYVFLFLFRQGIGLSVGQGTMDGDQMAHAAPGKALAMEMQRLRKPHLLKIYPAFGSNPRAGHNIHYRSVKTWERDVFVFLDSRMRH